MRSDVKRRGIREEKSNLYQARALARSRSRSELVVREVRFVDPIVARVCGRGWVPVLVSCRIHFKADECKKMSKWIGG